MTTCQLSWHRQGLINSDPGEISYFQATERSLRWESGGWSGAEGSLTLEVRKPEKRLLQLSCEKTQGSGHRSLRWEPGRWSGAEGSLTLEVRKPERKLLQLSCEKTQGSGHRIGRRHRMKQCPGSGIVGVRCYLEVREGVGPRRRLGWKSPEGRASAMETRDITWGRGERSHSGLSDLMLSVGHSSEYVQQATGYADGTRESHHPLTWITVLASKWIHCFGLWSLLASPFLVEQPVWYHQT